jgi:hypothetical protein
MKNSSINSYLKIYSFLLLVLVCLQATPLFAGNSEHPEAAPAYTELQLTLRNAASSTTIDFFHKVLHSLESTDKVIFDRQGNNFADFSIRVQGLNSEQIQAAIMETIQQVVTTRTKINIGGVNFHYSDRDIARISQITPYEATTTLLIFVIGTDLEPENPNTIQHAGSSGKGFE